MTSGGQSVKAPVVRLNPRDRSPAEVSAWIDEICSALGVSPTRLASMANLAHTTISRFISGKSVNKNISPSTVGAIRTVIFTAIEDGKLAAREDPFQHIELRSERNFKKTMADAGARFVFSGQVLREVKIIGVLGIGITQESLQPKMWDDISINILVDPEFTSEHIFGLEIREEENSVFHYGDIVFCVGLTLMPKIVREDCFLVLHVKSNAGGFENKLYKCVGDPSGSIWLIPTWVGFGPDEQIYLGSSIEEGIARFKLNAAVVVTSMRRELPLSML